MQKLVGILCLLLSISACQHSNLRSNQLQVQLGANLTFQLLTPADFAKELVLTQSAEIKFAEETHELLFQAEISRNKVVVVGLTTSGSRLFSIVYDGFSVEIEGADFIINKIQPLYLLADLQLSLWPMQKLEQSLFLHSPCFKLGDCQFVADENALNRKLIQQGEVILSIDYSGTPHFENSLVYEHFQRKYQLSITPLEVTPIDVSSVKAKSL